LESSLRQQPDRLLIEIGGEVAPHALPKDPAYGSMPTVGRSDFPFEHLHEPHLGDLPVDARALLDDVLVRDKRLDEPLLVQQISTVDASELELAWTGGHLIKIDAMGLAGGLHFDARRHALEARTFEPADEKLEVRRPGELRNDGESGLLVVMFV